MNERCQMQVTFAQSFSLIILYIIESASKGSSSDAIEEPFLVPQRTIQSNVL